MESTSTMRLVFSQDFFDVIVATLEEFERLKLKKIPNMLIIKALFNSPCSALKQYFREMEINLDLAGAEIDKCIEKHINNAKPKKFQKVNPISGETSDQELAEFLKFCDYKTILFAKNSVMQDDASIDEIAFILGLLRNEDKDFLEFLKKVDKVHLKPWLLEMHLKGVQSEERRIEFFKSYFYS